MHNHRCLYYLPTVFYTDFNVDERFFVPHFQYFPIHSWKTADIPTRKASKKNFRSKRRISVSNEAIYLVGIQIEEDLELTSTEEI